MRDETITDPATFWDFDFEKSGSYLGAVQEKIIEVRISEDQFFDTGSVRWLAKGCGA